MKTAFGGAFDGTKVLVTGHTGFKGSWLSIWLRELGAEVVGYSLEPPTEPSNFEVSRVSSRVTDIRSDVRDLEKLCAALAEHRPEVVFHLAAQSLVLEAYRSPVETLHVNSQGTVHLLEAVRATEGVRAVIAVTTDKCYEDQGFVWGYRESDTLGGHDPYSASKAMAELAVASYRRSFGGDGGDLPPVATARAGNVIGGGDWSADRLVPDSMRALLAGEELVLRNPAHVRPWQHVVEPLGGYLWLAARLLADGDRYAGAWNFGPSTLEMVTTERLVREIIRLWGGGSYAAGEGQAARETTLLNLNWEKAARRLEWRPAYDWREALAATVAWYRTYRERTEAGSPPDMYDVCAAQLRDYTDRARGAGIAWASSA